MGDPASQPGMLKLVFEENCVVVDDTEEYYFDSLDSLKTVGQLCAFLEGQETFPKDKKVMPFSVKGRKIGSKEAAASTVAFIRIEAPEGCSRCSVCAHADCRSRAIACACACGGQAGAQASARSRAAAGNLAEGGAPAAPARRPAAAEARGRACPR